DLGPRPRADRRHPRRNEKARPGGNDHDRRHARDGIRPRGGGPPHVHGRGSGRRGGAGARRHQEPEERTHAGVPEGDPVSSPTTITTIEDSDVALETDLVRLALQAAEHHPILKAVYAGPPDWLEEARRDPGVPSHLIDQAHELSAQA